MSWGVTLSLATRESAQLERLVSAVERVAVALERLQETPPDLGSVTAELKTHDDAAAAALASTQGA